MECNSVNHVIREHRNNYLACGYIFDDGYSNSTKCSNTLHDIYYDELYRRVNDGSSIPQFFITNDDSTCLHDESFAITYELVEDVAICEKYCISQKYCTSYLTQRSYNETTCYNADLFSLKNLDIVSDLELKNVQSPMLDISVCDINECWDVSQSCKIIFF